MLAGFRGGLGIHGVLMSHDSTPTEPEPYGAVSGRHRLRGHSGKRKSGRTLPRWAVLRELNNWNFCGVILCILL